MSNEFMREARYVVLKSADVMKCLTVSELIELRRIQAKVEEHRAEIGKPPLDCVVVESDWPEYEPTWKAIETRVTGAQAQPALSQSAQGIKDDIVSDLQTQFDTEGITEYDSGDALIRLSDAIAAVEDNFALAQPAPKAVAYLDLGTGGYIDIGTDLTDEELAALPKGRHMLGVIGTYGVDGYVPAQPAPSVPEVTDAMIEAIESRAEQSYRRHHGGARGQQIVPADALSWHIIHATRKVLSEAPEAKP